MGAFRLEDTIPYLDLNREEKKAVRDIMKIIDGMTMYQINHVLKAAEAGATVLSKVTLPKYF